MHVYYNRAKRASIAPNYIVECMESRMLLSTASLVKDINTGTLGNTATPLGRLGSTLIFAENDGVHGVEPYKTDGTAAGTAMVKDVVPGPADGVYIPFESSPAAVLNGDVYFSSVANNELSLWRTDGTAAGTNMVVNVLGGGAPEAGNFMAAGSKLFFTANVGSTSEELYVSDGTSGGTQPFNIVANIPSLSITGMEVVNNKLFFTGEAASQSYLYVTDGTQAGTIQLASGVGDNGMFYVGNKCLINSGGALWVSNGTVAGTTTIASFVSVLTYGSGSTNAFLLTTDGSGSGFTLYSTNGTAAGTVSIKGGFQNARPGMGALPNGSELFVAELNNAYSLYVTNGTSTGTISLANIDAGNQNFSVADVGSVGIFAATDPVNGDSLWVSNGTAAGTSRIAVSSLSTNGPSNFLAGSPVYFSDDDGIHGQELWKSDGTAAGTSMVDDVDTVPKGSGPSNFGVVNGKLWFLANDGVHGTQPWMSDGTAGGTTIANTSAAIAFPYNPMPNPILGLGAKAFFVGVDSSGVFRLYYSTGSGAIVVANGSTPLIVDSYYYSEVPPTSRIPVLFNNAIYFLGTDGTTSGIWKPDGTTAGTALASGSAAIAGATTLLPGGNYLYFDGTDGQNSQIFSINSSNQIVQLTHFTGLSSLLGYRAIMNNKLYFLVSTAAGAQLWESDGTAACTAMVQQFANFFPDSIAAAIDEILQVGNILFASADNGTTGLELYRIYNQNTITGTAGNDAITLTQDSDHTHIDWKLSVSSGEFAINDPAGLTINGNGANDTITLNYANGNPLPNTLHLNGTFTINGLTGTNPLTNTTLEIGTSTVYISYANAASDPLAVVRSYLQNGYNNGLWTGTPTSTTGVITSNAAAANANHATAIGYADSADGLVALPANTIELKYTLYGDTGLTGTVGFTDFMRMTQHYTQNSGATWSDGDFNYDGSVNVADFNLLQPDYGQSLPAPILTPIVVAPPSPARPPRVVTAPPPAAVLMPSLDGNAAVITTPLVATDLTKAKNHVGRKTAHTARR